jgi:hypothetical protein
MEVPSSRGAHGAGQREIDMGNHGAQNLTKPHLGPMSGRNRDAASFSHLQSAMIATNLAVRPTGCGKGNGLSRLEQPNFRLTNQTLEIRALLSMIGRGRASIREKTGSYRSFLIIEPTLAA